MSRRKITLVAAMGLNHAIGKDNDLLWSIPEDMKLFRRNTLGRAVLMGRKTAESIKGTLPKRRNLVLTSRSAPFSEQEAVRSIDEALRLLEDDEELCVIGGGQLYELALPIATHLKLTIVDDAPDADVFFPNVDLTDGRWHLISSEQFPEGDRHPSFTYREYIRHEPIQVPES